MLGRWIQRRKAQGVIGLNQRNIELIYPHNQRKHYSLADDKVEGKTLLHEHRIMCANTYAVIRNVSQIQRYWEEVRLQESLVLKPARGCGGGGILLLRKDEEGQWRSSGKIISEKDIRQHITQILSGVYSMASSDTCLIEECLVPDPFFAEIYPEGVPDFRIITLKGKPLMAMLRMPTSKSDGKANLHQNGVGIGVDMETGTLTQVYDGKRYTDHHPDNEVPVRGRRIPYWFTMLDLARMTAKAFPLEYLGIDLVLDKNKGPLVMEVNVRPGLGIQLVNQQGLMTAINKQ